MTTYIEKRDHECLSVIESTKKLLFLRKLILERSYFTENYLSVPKFISKLYI